MRPRLHGLCPICYQRIRIHTDLPYLAVGKDVRSSSHTCDSLRRGRCTKSRYISLFIVNALCIYAFLSCICMYWQAHLTPRGTRSAGKEPFAATQAKEDRSIESQDRGSKVAVIPGHVPHKHYGMPQTLTPESKVLWYRYARTRMYHIDMRAHACTCLCTITHECTSCASTPISCISAGPRPCHNDQDWQIWACIHIYTNTWYQQAEISIIRRPHPLLEDPNYKREQMRRKKVGAIPLRTRPPGLERSFHVCKYLHVFAERICAYCTYKICVFVYTYLYASTKKHI